MAPPNDRWPPERLPIEIFVIVAEHLGRRDVRALRLVNKEFYRNLSGYYLRQLVVSVDPDLCATLNPGAPGKIDFATLDVTNHIVDSSHVFSTYGDQIRRFALALELTEAQLATPPFPTDETIEVRPWGMYRWPATPDPSKKSPLENITLSLERSQGLFRILTHLGEVQELALSCEGGLGFLQGPDGIGPKGTIRQLQPAIFGDEENGVFAEPYRPDFTESYAYLKLEKMMRDVKLSDLMQMEPVRSHSIPALIEKLLAWEGSSLETFSGEERVRCPLPAREREGEMVRSSESFRDCCPERSKLLRLQPDMLTQNQKRFLAQHIMAQQALIQAYQLAVMDNAPSFENLRKFKVASLPSFHIDLLCRDDFWAELPMLKEVSLAVVPDWRSLSQIGPHVEDIQVYPADAILKVFRLLNDYIGRQPNVENLHFEWLCGGELASGLHQRNKLVLPGPFMKDHRKIVNFHPNNLLILPYVTHLSLKNCWFTPHVLYRIVREMSLKSLVSLELSTVSISGPPLDRPRLDNVHMADPPIWGLTPSPDGVVAPPHLSWGHIIDMWTPGNTIREHVFNRDNLMKKKLRLSGKMKLKKLVFKSCGYVEVPDGRFVRPWPFEGYQKQDIEPMAERLVDTGLEENCRCVRHFMQANTDRHLARVIGGIPRIEGETLKSVFGFKFGWRESIDAMARSKSHQEYVVYDEATYMAAWREGVRTPGRGRFSGTIEHQTEELTPLRRYEGIFYPKALSRWHEKKPKGEDGDDDDGDTIVDPVEVYNSRRFDSDYDDNVDESLDKLMTMLELNAGYVTKGHNDHRRRLNLVIRTR